MTDNTLRVISSMRLDNFKSCAFVVINSIVMRPTSPLFCVCSDCKENAFLFVVKLFPTEPLFKSSCKLLNSDSLTEGLIERLSLNPGEMM